MKIKLLVTCFIVLFLTIPSYCQFGLGLPKMIVKEGKFSLLTGYNYNRNHFGEIGIVRGWRCNYVSPCDDVIGGEMFYYYSSLSTEIMFSEKIVVCPKFGYHFVFGVVGIGANIFVYTDFTKHKFGIRPEIGLTLGGLVGAYYGYNLTTKNNFYNVSKHNIAVKMILFSGMFVDEEWRKKHRRGQN